MQPTMIELLFLLFPAICFKVQDALYVFVLVGLKRKKEVLKVFPGRKLSIFSDHLFVNVEIYMVAVADV